MKKVYALGLLPVLALTGCYGIKKVSFDEFKADVKEAVKETPKVKEVYITGKYDGDKVSVKIEIPDSLGSLVDFAFDGNYSANEKAAYSIAASNQTPEGYAILENDDATYYTGFGFKYKTDKKALEWNGKGLLSSYKEDATSLNFVWKKA